MADRKKKPVAPDGFPEKWYKKVPTVWKDGAEAMDNEDLKKEVLKASSLVSDTEREMDEDPKLNDLKADLKDLRGGYMDLINAERAKVKYSLFLLRSRGAQ
jgi:hypothetical protein